MTARCSRPEPRPQPLYFAEARYGKLGNEFPALDRDKNSRAEMIRQIRNNSIDPVKVLEVIEPCQDFPLGRCLDVTEELCAAASEQQRDLKLPPEAQELIDMLHDRARDLKKHGVYGW